MSYPKFLQAAILTLLLISVIETAAQVKIPFTFSIGTAGNTSAGVFAKDGKLLKTLWNGVKYDAGSHNASWDGTGDDGTLLPNADYDIRVLSNNVTYTWDGVVGNTSESFTGPQIYRSYIRAYGMAIAGNTAYGGVYYNEGRSSQFKFSLNNPQAKTELLTPGQSTLYVATDGNHVYWAGDDRADNHSNWFVFATNVSDDAETIFPNGHAYASPYGRTYSSVIDFLSNSSVYITGMAVQKAGNYLFIARANLNQVKVLDKNTGALVRTLNVTAPQLMAVDASDNLWMISAAGINKYPVNGDGTLGTSTVSVTGILQPLAIACSPDGSTVTIADGSTSQQVKGFSNTSGALLWTLGQAGGYETDATVTNNKFYFTDVRHSTDGSFIAYQPDGSFWVEDAGNFRTQHYSAGRNFIDRIMYLPSFYGCSADPNNPSRVFADWLEFNVDYSKPLAPNNGSWTLVRNWGHNITPAYNDRLREVTTLPNGRTYAYIHANQFEFVELVTGGDLRFTGYKTTTTSFSLLKDGTLMEWGGAGMGQPFGAGIHALNGFDGSGNPVWDASITQRSNTENVKADDPVNHGSGNLVKTSSGLYVPFDAGLPPNSSTNYHLAAFKNNQWQWHTARSTHKSYTGPFPDDGAYDIGNSVEYAGSMAVALDRSIIWGYHGEFWKGGQTNYFNHVYDNGLLISLFGVSGGSNSGPGVAGNVLALALVKDANGNCYLYHNDEHAHGGIHRWKIAGMETIKEQTIPVTFTIVPGGLLTRYFDGDDLNNFNTKITRVNTLVNFNPVPTEIPNTSNYSSRWTGFINANFTENYTFYTNSSKGVRVWINNTLVINNWNNTSQTESSGSIALQGGKKYLIMLEMKNSTASFSWSSASQPKQIVPTSNLIPAVASEPSAGVDLLEGLPFKNILEDNLYGWKRNLKDEDTTGVQHNNWWTVKTSVQAYKKPDVYTLFTQYNKNVVYTVTRDLGNQSGAWKLSGHLNHEGDAPGPIDNGGAGHNFAVLDNTGKTIVNLVAYINNQTGNNLLYGNSQLIAEMPGAAFNDIWGGVQPVEISADNGLISIAFGPFAKITTTPMDATSDWQNPKSMVLYFRSNSSNRTRAADVTDMRFFSAAQILLPVNLLSFKALNAAEHVDLQWIAENEINTSSFTVERSADGRNFTALGEVKARNLPGTNNYNFNDNNPLSGISYYRLKMTDTDGKFTYSKVALVNRKVSARFSVYPNPAENIVRVDYPATAENGFLEIVSVDGKKVKNIDIGRGTSYQMVNVESLNAGYYFINLKKGVSIYTAPFLKK